MGNVKNFDLNLLRTFDTLMEEKSVLRAGQKLNITQSAVSHALSRLRLALGDELFVRVGSRMEPTERASELAPIVRNALLSLESAVTSQAFDPASARRSFVIAANDLTTMLLMPAVLDKIRKTAPYVDLIIKPATRIDLAEQIDLGQIDIAIGTFSTTVTRFRSSPLFSYDDVLIAGNSVTSPITLDKLRDLVLYVVSFGADHAGLDGYLVERGLARRSDMYDRTAFEKAYPSGASPRVGVILPHFLALPAMLAAEGVAAIVPRQFATRLATDNSVKSFELPFPTSVFDVSALWHVRHNRDPAHTWLRQTIVEASAALRDEM